MCKINSLTPHLHRMQDQWWRSVAVLPNVCVSTNSICGKSALTEATVCIEQLKPGRDGMERSFTQFSKWNTFHQILKISGFESNCCSLSGWRNYPSIHNLCSKHTLKMNWSEQNLGETVYRSCPAETDALRRISVWMTLICHICVEGDDVAAVCEIPPGIFCWIYDSQYANRD